VSKVRVSRSLHLRSAAGTNRKETYKGREYLVVPVVALVEGVIWPVNAETPEYVTEESFSLAPESWNGRPVFSNHPMRGGTQVLGNTPEILESEQFGIVFAAGTANHKLTMEAWLNKDDAESVGDAAVNTYDRAEAGGDIEISVGSIVLMEEVAGEYNGQEYKGKWLEIFPDHLALLQEGDIGACSISMGCGVRTATVHLITAKGYSLVTAKEGAPVPAEKKEVRKSILQRLMGGIFRTASPAGRSNTDVQAELTEALEEVEPRMKYSGWVVDYYENEGLVVYCMYDESYDMDLYVRDYTWDGKTAKIGTLYAEVEAHTVYEVEDDENQANEVLITQLRAAQKIAAAPVVAASAPCGCGGKKTTTTAQTSASTGESGMTKDERIAAMIAASGGKLTDADKTWLSAVPEAQLTGIEAANKVEATPAAPAAAVPVAAAAAPVPAPVVEKETQEQFLARNPDLKKIVDRQAAQDKARRTYLVGKLKTAQTEYTEEQMNVMPIEELERTARLLKIGGPEPVNDYSGIAVPRDAAAADQTGAPAPPDQNAAIRAARGAK
jgi:hypothetical protein